MIKLLQRLLFLLFILLTAPVVQAQELRLVGSEDVFEGLIGSTISSKVQLFSERSEEVIIKLEVADKQLNTGSQLSICYAGKCYSDLAELPLIALHAPEGRITILLKLTAGITEGRQTVRLKAIDAKTNVAFGDEEIMFNVALNKEKKPALVHNERFDISNVYPNPVTSYAHLQYQIDNDDTEKLISVYSVLGSQVGEFELLPEENELKIDMSKQKPGVYFYALKVDGNTMVTKKFVYRP